MLDLSSLFHKFTHRNIELRNRIVMAPMTRSFSPDHIPSDQVVKYYHRRAKHGVGLIITEGTCIDHPSSNGHRDVPFIYGDKALMGWRKVVDSVHDEGSKIIPQLWHVGAVRAAGSEPNPMVPGFSPSGLVAPGRPSGHMMTKQDIQEVIDSFRRAARSALEVGFDGIELHGAHGYLIDQFFWQGTNIRDDEYGGSLDNRTRFAKQVVQAIRNDLGDDFLIVLRWSQWKMQDFNARLVNTPEELNSFLQPLVAAGVDILHCSTRKFWEPAFATSELTLAGWTRKLSALPTIAVGSVGTGYDFLGGSINHDNLKQEDTLAKLERMLNEGEFDLIAVGRALIADPAWPKKIRAHDFTKIKPYDRRYLSALE